MTILSNVLDSSPTQIHTARFGTYLPYINQPNKQPTSHLRTTYLPTPLYYSQPPYRFSLLALLVCAPSYCRRRRCCCCFWKNVCAVHNYSLRLNYLPLQKTYTLKKRQPFQSHLVSRTKDSKLRGFARSKIKSH